MPYEVQPEKPHFVNRAAERARALGRIDEWHEEFRPLWFSVSGIAGIGKTELAHTFVRDRLVRFPDGVMALDLDDLRARETKVLDPLEIAGSLLRKLGVPPEWSGSSFADVRWASETRGNCCWPSPVTVG